MLAKGKSVHREVEFEGSLRQSPEPTNRNRIKGKSKADEFPKQNKIQNNETVIDLLLYCPNLAM